MQGTDYHISILAEKSLAGKIQGDETAGACRVDVETRSRKVIEPADAISIHGSFDTETSMTRCLFGILQA